MGLLDNPRPGDLILWIDVDQSRLDGVFGDTSLLKVWSLR